MKPTVITKLAMFSAAIVFMLVAVDHKMWPASGWVQAQQGDPELPRVRLDTTYVPPTGLTIIVSATGNFQAALNQAQPNDVIILQAGATYAGNFIMPKKTGTGWIVIRSSAPDSSLPPQGTRITPASASNFPKVITPNRDPVLTTNPGAHHYRFIGIEFGVAPGNPITNLLEFGAGERTLADVPNNLIIDRCYLHGTRDKDARRGIALNSASSAVIDSYLSDFHEFGADSQAIASWNSPGPLKIVNNYLEGSGENVMFGGADPTVLNLVPSDIEFRRNHCFKPLSWKRDDPSYAGIRWSVKNLFELKNAQRVLVEGNIFENNWVDAQSGFAILFTVRNQDGTAPWSVVQDVTFINNIVRHTGSGISLSGTDDNRPSQQTKRIRISNNLFDDVDGPRWSGALGALLLLIAGPSDIRFEHNTAFQSNFVAAVDVFPPPGTGFVFQDNLMPHNEFGFFGSGKGTGKSALDFYFSNYIFRKNALIGGRSQDYPADNFFPESIAQAGFVNRAGGDYRLLGSSPLKNAGSDGKDIGCNFDTLEAVVFEPPNVSSVSSASFSGAVLAPESITSAFGVDLSTATVSATTVPLPTVLGGTSLRVRDRSGIDRLSPLFFISPKQANYLIPPETVAGAARVTVKSGDRLLAVGSVQIDNVAPGVFTVDASGRGLPAATVLRINADGERTFEPIARFDAAQNRFVAVPIDFGPSTDQIYLLLYATGLRFNSSLSAVSAKIGGLDAQVLYAGAQGGFSGLDQVNLLLPRSLAGRGNVDLALTVDGKFANTVQLNVK